LLALPLDAEAQDVERPAHVRIAGVLACGRREGMSDVVAPGLSVIAGAVTPVSPRGPSTRNLSKDKERAKAK